MPHGSLFLPFSGKSVHEFVVGGPAICGQQSAQCFHCVVWPLYSQPPPHLEFQMYRFVSSLFEFQQQKSFTMHFHPQTINFLDVTLYSEGDHVQTSLFRKPTWATIPYVVTVVTHHIW